ARRVLPLLPLVAFAFVAARSVVLDGNDPGALMFCAAVFVWIGMALPRWSAAAYVVPFGLAFLAPLMGTDRTVPSVAGEAALAALFLVVLAEVVAWATAAARDEAASNVVAPPASSVDDEAALGEQVEALGARCRTLEWQTTHDELTGFVNRDGLLDELRRLLAAMAATPGRDGGRRHEQVAVFLVDVDGFVEVNETLGSVVSDQLLLALARRLRAITQPIDALVGRIGDDDFAIVVAGPSDRRHEITAAELVDTLGVPYTVGGRRMPLSVSVGWATTDVVPVDHVRADRLLVSAGIATLAARRAGGRVSRRFDLALRASTARRMSMVEELQTADLSKRIATLFQPVMDLSNRRPWGFEALARWNHPTEGLLGPNDFLPVAEELGAIDEIAEVVLERVSALQRSTLETRSRTAVNVSGRSLARRWMVDVVRQLEADGRLDPTRLVVEVTEHDLASAFEPAMETLRALRDLGVSIAIDDFGRGHSSFTQLRNIPADVLKLDGEFVPADPTERGARTMLAAAADLGRRLGMDVVAERVETTAQLDMVTAAGIELVQGFLFAGPMPLDEASRFGVERRQVSG
ncbi:MAG: GGDEF domain-containing phosphodiesterase, partial [Actinomycetota bacterium]|nr:GGDEF domain-containing phosphodiesterase [Actinomycetota bacterium]